MNTAKIVAKKFAKIFTKIWFNSSKNIFVTLTGDIKMTPVQRLGITNMQFKYSDIIYFR